MKKFLQCYPFSHPHIRLVEGFSAYDGTIGDMPGAPHKGIDYIRKEDEICQPFSVYAMHDGMALRGISESWGNFVIIHNETIDDQKYSTIYAHLSDIDPSIAHQSIEKNGKQISNEDGTRIQAGRAIGLAGISGLTHGIIQLHLEFHVKDLKRNTTQKEDPYGVYDRASSGRYPQPGESLHGLDHAWVSDSPPLG